MKRIFALQRLKQPPVTIRV